MDPSRSSKRAPTCRDAPHRAPCTSAEISASPAGSAVSTSKGLDQATGAQRYVVERDLALRLLVDVAHARALDPRRADAERAAGLARPGPAVRGAGSLARALAAPPQVRGEIRQFVAPSPRSASGEALELQRPDLDPARSRSGSSADVRGRVLDAREGLALEARRLRQPAGADLDARGAGKA